RARAGQTARTPILLGTMRDDGSITAANLTSLEMFIQTLGPGGTALTPDELRAVYPNRTDAQILQDAARDDALTCPEHLFADALIESGVASVFRYIYGAVFADNQPFPNAGAWHTSELPELFGTFNHSTATTAEAELSRTFQTALANFVKDPTARPAPGWPEYVPGNTSRTLAEIAFHGNVGLDNFVQLVMSDSVDRPCLALWDGLRDFNL
ncbi:Alpha/Beta hydrolase protein, partial [Vararia minispora EC-137]